MRRLLAFMVMIWGLLIGGGYITVNLLGPITVSGYGELDGIIESGIKAAVALLLVLGWVLLLVRLKNLLLYRTDAS